MPQTENEEGLKAVTVNRDFSILVFFDQVGDPPQVGHQAVHAGTHLLYNGTDLLHVLLGLDRPGEVDDPGGRGTEAKDVVPDLGETGIAVLLRNTGESLIKN